jgi:hypothetical protein
VFEAYLTERELGNVRFSAAYDGEPDIVGACRTLAIYEYTPCARSGMAQRLPATQLARGSAPNLGREKFDKYVSAVQSCKPMGGGPGV